MIFQGAFADSYMKDDLDKDGNVKQISKFVFIGRNLDKELLTKLFEACRAEELRFAIGMKVLVRTKASPKAPSGGSDLEAYEGGTVIGHWDQGNAYRVRLNPTDKDGDGEWEDIDKPEVWAPADIDVFIRQA